MQYHEHLILVRIETKPEDIFISQVYMPIIDEEDEVMEKCFEDLSELMENINGKQNLIVLGDSNATKGEGTGENTVSKYELGKINERRERLIEFCVRHDMVVTNTTITY